MSRRASTKLPRTSSEPTLRHLKKQWQLQGAQDHDFRELVPADEKWQLVFCDGCRRLAGSQMAGCLRRWAGPSSWGATTNCFRSLCCLPPKWGGFSQDANPARPKFKGLQGWDGGAVNATGSDHDQGHHSHPHDGLFFLLLSFTIGILITALTMVRYTSWETSWQMWMEIDPHLLLFTMLPSLLMADAMTIHTGVAMRVAKQCIYLAGPGVLINALLAACFLYVYLPYQWPFLLCLTTGSILCATDPVAVVALLKEPSSVA
eukprot:s863_g15.t1